LKNRKNHETLDFENTPNAHLIFLSFLTLFMKMKFQNFYELKIYFFGLSITDEKEIDYETNFDFVLNFINLIHRIKQNSFKMEILKELDNEILNILNEMETKFPQKLFEDTRPKILEEIKECKMII